MFKRILLFTAVSIAMLSCTEKKKQETGNTTPPTPPNVIIIFTDDQGYEDVGCFGSTDIKTPHLDEMAREGIKLTNFYAAQAVCSASRAALLTGCYPNRIGIHNALMPQSKIGLNPDETTLADMLKTKGYSTALYGKWHLGDHPDFMPNKQGFDDYFGILFSGDMWPHHPQQGPVFNFDPLLLYENEKVIDTLDDQSMLTTQITEKAVSFIENNKEKPFFLYVAHPQPHVPLFVSDKFKGKSERGLYGDVIMEIDWSVGQILQSLEDNQLDENTLVIFTSDNGPWLAYGDHAGSAYPFREGKGTAWEGGQREPFIARFPGKLPENKTINTPVMAIDLLPTIASLTNSALPEQKIDGKNIWDILAGETKENPHEAYYFYYKVNELQGVRYQDWKLYFPHTYRTMEGQEPGKGGQPGEYKQIALEEIELYNLSVDSTETHNVAEKHPEVVEKIVALANKKRQELGDNLLDIKGNENREPGKVE
ncbi:sulfatase family protein [Sinomicrobium weinanense]|uniref:Sulfatase n=1 Tax=Sinomicrobium weinanense TaxID=2842200 RepID=A0A926JQY9_9FLAO|nr:sulfatase [Sinomicrobium weinanense]MBC9795875.1 sulfatase [Sinomicrobium weinanense]MBU3125395.1 sulfatase [Sinomicrobium weinanense]